MTDLIARAARDIAGSAYAVALTGAGISTESGITDFRGPSGVWTKNPEAEAQAYRSYPDFTRDPKIWWENLLTGKTTDPLGPLDHAQPNAGHIALVELEKIGILKTTITQNIDSLHEKAGCAHLLEFHGSRSKLRCLACNARFSPDEFDFQQLRREDRLPPRCLACNQPLKSDVVYFGEPIPSDVAEESYAEALRCDLMLVAGTSAAVYPFANLPRIARQRGAVKIIEVNAESTALTREGISDYLIQGKTGEILPAMVGLVKELKTNK